MTTETALLSPCFQQVPIAGIAIDQSLQSRVKVRAEVVRTYARTMGQQVSEGGLRFPPVVLFTDGHHFWVGDGFHRLLAAREAGLSEFPADVHSGTERDALLWSISANSEHGLPRTSADKRKAVALLLNDPEWSLWSDREIARRCQVSHPSVTKLRKELSGKIYQMRPRKVKRGDTTYEMRAGPKGERNSAPDQPSRVRRGSPELVDELA
jgi:hypothetical protein